MHAWIRGIDLTKFRLKLEKVENGKYKHMHNIVIESDDELVVIKKVQAVLFQEIWERQKNLLIWANRRRKNYVKRLMDEIPDDLIDWASKGKDISKEEFLENEIFLTTKEV